jgi:hypothetical protein
MIVCGLDYLSTIETKEVSLGHSRLVSTPSPFEAWLGIASSKVSPNLRVYATYRFQHEAPFCDLYHHKLKTDALFTELRALIHFT